MATLQVSRRQSVAKKGNRSLLTPSSRRNNIDSAPVLSTANEHLEANTPKVIFNGEDVTPLPLLKTDYRVSGGTADGSILASGRGSLSNLSAFPHFPGDLIGVGGISFAYSDGDDAEEPILNIPTSTVQHIHSSVDSKMKDYIDLGETISINIEETDTFFLLEIPSVAYSVNSEEGLEVAKRSEQYLKMISGKVGNDRYVEHGMNTFNFPPKNKAIQTLDVTQQDSGTQLLTYDMYDSYAAIEEKLRETREEEENVEKEEITEEEDGKNCRESDKTKIFYDLVKEEGSEDKEASEKDSFDEEAVLKSENLEFSMVVMERVVNLNTYQSKQATYCGLPPLQGATTINLGPSLERLWSFQSSVTQSLTVTCIAFNHQNSDLLAVGYGTVDFATQKSGMICCWSLKNPEHPERIFTCEHSVIALDFSQQHTNLLAAGLYDGSILLYNVKLKKNEAILDTFDSAGKHIGAVWHLSWVQQNQGAQTKENLISISADGRITCWAIRKGFESMDIMKLKRPSAKIGKSKNKKEEAFISKYSAGFSFDFHPTDTTIYLTGAEDGSIHKCSTSYTEQYLETYSSHSGPVYQLQWSPFCTDTFLSCSGDWTVRLWQQSRTEPLLSLHAASQSVQGAEWSPRNSTVFACFCDGQVEVWDLAVSTLDPLILNTALPGTKFTHLAFALNADCIMLGDSLGQVTVYQLCNMPEPPLDQAAALQQVIETALSHKLESKLATENGNSSEQKS